MKRLALALLLLAACKKEAPAGGPLRLAFFPNLTHAQALVGAADGSFSQALGGRLTVRQFNAGPAAMEALLAGDVDLCYVGPGPAVVAFLRSEGALRVVAGAASGGAALVGKDVAGAEALAGKRVASPQLGNTQDIALRTWLAKQGLGVGDQPGQVRVTPLANPDILQLVKRGDVTAAWVPEPWAARLVAEAGAKILVDERTLWPGGKFPTTVLVATRRALETRRADVVAAVRAHLALTERWRRDPEAFAAAANAEYGKLTGHALPPEVLADAFARLEPASDPMPAALAEQARQARALGFAPEGDLARLVDPSVLAEARR